MFLTIDVALLRTPLFMLAVSITGMAMPCRARRRVNLQHGIRNEQALADTGIICPAQAESNQGQELQAHHIFHALLGQGIGPVLDQNKLMARSAEARGTCGVIRT